MRWKSLFAGLGCLVLGACATFDSAQDEPGPPRSAAPHPLPPRPVPHLAVEGRVIPALLHTSAVGGVRTDTRRAYLGIAWATLPGQGARVTRFLERDAPAARAGLRIGDVITAFNGMPIVGRGDLSARLEALAPGAAVILRITRSGTSERVEIITDRR